MPLPLALISWLLMGLLSGFLAAWLLPSKAPYRFVLDPITGLIGALGGGLLATALGFGGIVGYDTRALAAAALMATLFLLISRNTRKIA